MDILIKKYLWVLNLLGVVLCAYFLAKIASVLIADQLIMDRKLSISSSAPEIIAPKIMANFDQYKIITDRNMFDSKEVAAPIPTETAESTAPVNLDGPAVPTSLSIQLLATFSVGSGTDQRSTATIQSGGGAKTVDVYSIGDEKQFSSGVKITKILPNRVEFVNAGRLEYVELQKVTGAGGISSSTAPKSDAGGTKAGVVSQGQNKFSIDQSELDNALNNLNKIFTEVRAVPNFGPGGKPAGIKLLSMTSTSFFSKLGLQRGDVLERINGSELDMQRGLEIFNQLKGEKHITIDLSRNGQKQTLDYEIK